MDNTVATAAELLAAIGQLVADSGIEAGLQGIIQADLEQAQRAYGAEAYKACIVMLGAALEGIMLGVLRQPAVLRRLQADSELPNKLWKRLGGQGHFRNADFATFAAQLGPRLTFADYTAILQGYLPQLEALKIDGIPSFWHAIHPWKTMATPHLYGVFDQPRALSHLRALHILTVHLTQWRL